MRIISDEGFLLIGFFLFACPEGLSTGNCERALRERFPLRKEIVHMTQFNATRSLLAEGLIEKVLRTEKRLPRGRPPQNYQITAKGTAHIQEQLALFADVLRAYFERPVGSPVQDDR